MADRRLTCNNLDPGQLHPGNIGAGPSFPPLPTLNYCTPFGAYMALVAADERNGRQRHGA